MVIHRRVFILCAALLLCASARVSAQASRDAHRHLGLSDVRGEVLPGVEVVPVTLEKGLKREGLARDARLPPLLRREARGEGLRSSRAAAPAPALLRPRLGQQPHARLRPLVAAPLRHTLRRQREGEAAGGGLGLPRRTLPRRAAASAAPEEAAALTDERVECGPLNLLRPPTTTLTYTGGRIPPTCGRTDPSVTGGFLMRGLIKLQEMAGELISRLPQGPRRALKRLAGVSLSGAYARDVWPQVLEHKWYLSRPAGRRRGLLREHLPAGRLARRAGRPPAAAPDDDALRPKDLNGPAPGV
jgi:hypothetical protein